MTYDPGDRIGDITVLHNGSCKVIVGWDDEDEYHYTATYRNPQRALRAAAKAKKREARRRAAVSTAEEIIRKAGETVGLV